MCKDDVNALNALKEKTKTFFSDFENEIHTEAQAINDLVKATKSFCTEKHLSREAAHNSEDANKKLDSIRSRVEAYGVKEKFYNEEGKNV